MRMNDASSVDPDAPFGDLELDALELERFEAVADDLTPEEWRLLQPDDEREGEELIAQIVHEHGCSPEEAYRQVWELNGVSM